MMEDHIVFEWMIHIMELSVVIGIGVVIWYIKTQSKKRKHGSQIQHNENPHTRSDCD